MPVYPLGHIHQMGPSRPHCLFAFAVAIATLLTLGALLLSAAKASFDTDALVAVALAAVTCVMAFIHASRSAYQRYASQRAQQELAALAREAHTIRENEKTRIARELHDELAQSLSALKMDTAWIRHNLPQGMDVVSTKLDSMQITLNNAVVATRRIAADLRPLMLDDLGLIPAIEWLTNNFTERSGVACVFTGDDQIDLNEPYATAVFRIVQESLVNVAKHAQASKAEVRIQRTDAAVTVHIIDNGQGFIVAAPRKPHSLGLLGLRERAHLLKGTIHINSHPGQGTRIEVWIPTKNTGVLNDSHHRGG